MLGKILTLAAGFGLTVLLEVASATAQTYRNDEFGITLPVPKGLFLCPNPPDEHDHGPVLLFDPARANTCNDAQGGRFIGVFASYNAADVTKTLGKFLKWLCSEGGKRSCLPTPPNLEIPGMRTAAAEVRRLDGWVDVIMVTQAGKPDPKFDPSVPSVNYSLRLHTKPENLEGNLQIFRTVLQNIRLSPGH